MSPAPSLPAAGPALTILFDGGCPLCLREVRLLQKRDSQLHGEPERRLAFVDIDDPHYDPAAHGGISYREAMGRIHAIDAEGRVLRDLEVFRRAYALVGLGWLYGPTHFPLISPLADAAYRVWASRRLRWTRRPSLDTLCDERAGRCRL